MEEDILKDLFRYYVAEAHFRKAQQDAIISVSENRLLALMKEDLEEKTDLCAENLLAKTTTDYEMQGFINGFRFATTIWNACK